MAPTCWPARRRRRRSAGAVLLGSAPGRLTPEDERPEPRGGHDVQTAVAVEIGREQIGTGAGSIVNELRHELRSTRRLRVPDRAIPVEHCGAVRIGIEIVVPV